jgi:tetratricopeptide (TPR) repeat protein
MSKDEICFHMSTVFRIESVEETINDAMMIWLVKLKLINDDDQQLRRLVAPVRSDEIHANPASYVGKILMDMGEYRRAEQFLLELLKDTIVLNQPRRRLRVLNGLGVVYTYKNEHDKALEYYQQSLQTSLIYLKPDHPDLAPIYKAIGDTHLNQSDYIHAVEKYEKAIKLLDYGTQQIHSELLADLHTCVNRARQLIESNK